MRKPTYCAFCHQQVNGLPEFVKYVGELCLDCKNGISGLEHVIRQVHLSTGTESQLRHIEKALEELGFVTRKKQVGRNKQFYPTYRLQIIHTKTSLWLERIEKDYARRLVELR